MSEFETTASLSIEVDQRELRSVRQEIEDELSDVALGIEASMSGGGAGGGGNPAFARDRATMIRLDRNRNESLEDIIAILDDIEDGGGGGGDGGGSRFPRIRNIIQGGLGGLGGATIAVATQGETVGVDTTGETVGVATEGRRVGVDTTGEVGVDTTGERVEIAEPDPIGISTEGEQVQVATEGQMVGVDTTGAAVGVEVGDSTVPVSVGDAEVPVSGTREPTEESNETGGGIFDAIGFEEIAGGGAAGLLTGVGAKILPGVGEGGGGAGAAGSSGIGFPAPAAGLARLIGTERRRDPQERGPIGDFIGGLGDAFSSGQTNRGGAVAASGVATGGIGTIGIIQSLLSSDSPERGGIDSAIDAERSATNRTSEFGRENLPGLGGGSGEQVSAELNTTNNNTVDVTVDTQSIVDETVDAFEQEIERVERDIQRDIDELERRIERATR